MSNSGNRTTKEKDTVNYTTDQFLGQIEVIVFEVLIIATFSAFIYAIV